MLIIIIITAPNFLHGLSNRDASIVITTPTVFVSGILTLIIIGLIMFRCKRRPEQPQMLCENNNIANGGGNGFNDPTNEAIARELECSVYSNTTTAD